VGEAIAKLGALCVELQHETNPELWSQSHTVSEHVTIMGEDGWWSFGVSWTCQRSSRFGMRRRSGVASKRAHGQIEQRHHKIPDKLRLGMLHALQYANTTPNNAILAVKEVMKGGGASADNVTLVDAILRYAGSRA